MSLKNYKKIATEIRKEIVRMHSKADASHIASSLSCLDILVLLYFGIMRIDPKRPKAADRDRFILSKGHAASALYAVLCKRGVFNKKILASYCSAKLSLPGHATKGCVPFVEASTGSLGHGLPIGSGMALAGKYDGLDYRVFVLLSDGECDEGSTWEAALFASHHKLDNLVAIIDYNKLQAFGRTEEVLSLEPLAEKWKAFGWEAREVDGHNFAQMEKILKIVPLKKNRPTMIIAHTVKGKGISFMEDKLMWHYKSPQGEDFKNAMKELGALL